MYIPTSTYRLQANCNFTLHDIKEIVDYLEQLGVSTLYCAPFFQSRIGSNHGYDVIDPNSINHELGTLEELKEISAMLKSKNMGWLQDIVPNHMAYDSNNVWLKDLFKRGPRSDFFNFFDIDWEHQDEKLKHKVILPFLDEDADAFIEHKKIKVVYNQEGFFIDLYGAQYPILWSSYFMLFNQKENSLSYANEIIAQLKVEGANITESMLDKLFQYYNNHQEVKTVIDQALLKVNENTSLLRSLLEQQIFVLVPYYLTDSEINYRRFFTVNDLICLKMESPLVFNHYHQFLNTLLQEDIVQGLRADHIDGLADPKAYLESLRKLAGESCYIIVEKILEEKETMPSYWPIQGTSGYEFLSSINHVFTKSENQDKFTEIYRQFIGETLDYTELAFEKKHTMLVRKMNGELDNLVGLFLQLDPSQQGVQEKLKEALAILMSSFSVYRTYVSALPIQPEDRTVIEQAFTKAEQRNPEFIEQFLFMRSVLLVDQGDAMQDKKLQLLMRLQQFTGPLAAKGVEDTVFYIYNRLISHNEVGDCPDRFGISIQDFHSQMKLRLQCLPLSMNATSTHDTKRGEDARMRINALSEIPEAWSSFIMKWKEMNNRHKKNTAHGQIPFPNDEYFIYQSLVGGFPMDGIADQAFTQRMKEFMMKAMREGRVNSDWNKPNEEYEQATFQFIESVLKDEQFMESFQSLFQVVRHYGMILSLGQTLVKVTAPGIPDIFQGAELWDLNFVDPDNRRVINYETRKKVLSKIIATSKEVGNEHLKDLMDHPLNGEIKLFTLCTALHQRRLQPVLFQSGDYIPLTFSGPHSDHVIGFARHMNEQWAITIVPKEAKVLGSAHAFPLDDLWKDTVLILPSHAPDSWQNCFTHEEYSADHYTLEDKQPQESDAPIDAAFNSEILIGKRLELRKILHLFPVALLKNSHEEK